VVNAGAAGSYANLVASMCLWASIWSINRGPVHALYASSVTAGERSRYYTLRFQLSNVAATIGRLSTIAVFASRGNAWRVADLRVLLYAGLTLELLAALAMMAFRDDAVLPSDTKTTSAASVTAKTAPQASTTASASSSGGGAGVAGGAGDVDSGAPPVHPRAWTVPWVLFGSSVLFGLGSGATVKFFPLCAWLA
jgi:hypothetical protein